MFKRILLSIVALTLTISAAFADQNTLVVPGSPLTMLQLKTYLDNAFATVGSNFSGNIPPTSFSGSAKPFQFWLDQSTSPAVLRINDGTSWVEIGTLDTSTHTFSALITSLGTLTSLSVSGNSSLAGGRFQLQTQSGTTAFEFGNPTGSDLPFIDWHSSSTPNDYDVRMQASGGTTSSAGGTLSFYAAQLIFSGITTPSGTSSVFINLNSSSSVEIAPLSGATALHVQGVDSAATTFLSDSFASNGTYIYRRADGTAASPTALLASDQIGVIGFRGYDGSAYSNNQASIRGIAAENWGTSAHGLYLGFFTTPTGSTAQAEQLRIQASGGISLGNSVVTTDPGAGNTIVGGSLKVASITGATQCLHVNTAGLISGTGSDCGSGGGSGIIIGSTGITSGTNGRLLYDASGFVGEPPITVDSSGNLTATGAIKGKNASGYSASLGATCTVNRTDYASLNAAIAVLPSTGGTVCVGPGVWTETVQASWSGLDNVAILGSGMGTSVLEWTVTAGGISGSFATPATSNQYKQQFVLKDLTILTNQAGSAGSAVSISFATAIGDITPGVMIQNVEIEGLNDTEYWDRGIYLLNARNPHLSNVNITGYQEAGHLTVTHMGYGIYLDGGTVDTDISDTTIFNTQYAVYISGLVEGVHINHPTFVFNNYGIYYDYNSGHPGTLLSVANGHLSSLIEGIHTDHASDIFVSNMLIIRRDESQSNYADINILDTPGDGNCGRVSIHDNNFLIRVSGVGSVNGVIVNNDCTNIRVVGNRFANRDTAVWMHGGTVGNTVAGNNQNMGSVSSMYTLNGTGTNNNHLTDY